MIVTFFIGDPAICEVDKSLLLAQHKNSRFLRERLLLLAILSILVKKEMLETTLYSMAPRVSRGRGSPW